MDKVLVFMFYEEVLAIAEELYDGEVLAVYSLDGVEHERKLEPDEYHLIGDIQPR